MKGKTEQENKILPIVIIYTLEMFRNNFKHRRVSISDQVSKQSKILNDIKEMPVQRLYNTLQLHW